MFGSYVSSVLFELNDSTNTITDSNSTVYLFMMHQEQTCLCYIPVNYYFFLIWDRLFFCLPGQFAVVGYQAPSEELATVFLRSSLRRSGQEKKAGETASPPPTLLPLCWRSRRWRGRGPPTRGVSYGGASPRARCFFAGGAGRVFLGRRRKEPATGGALASRWGRAASGRRRPWRG